MTPDDYVFADDDGVVVVAAGSRPGVETARDIASREGAQAVRLLKGELLRTQFDLNEYVTKTHRRIRPYRLPRAPHKAFGGAIEI